MNAKQQQDTKQLIKSLKFVELHFHLDGSVSPDIALNLSDLQNVPLPTRDPEKLKEALQVSPGCRSLVEFLQHFEIPGSLMQTKEGISQAVYMVQEEFKRNNGIYLEIRFAPQLHCFQGLTQREVIEAALDGLHRSDLKANLILCLMRGDTNQKENMETILLAKEYLVEDDGVVALDLAGNEYGFKTHTFKQEFELANTLGIPFTIHAGEADGPSSVDSALSFGAKRIGHGIRSAESEDTMKKLVQNDVLLELCPLSNFCTKSCTEEEFPFKQFLERGVKMCINTDDMGIIGNTIQDDFEFVVTRYGLNKEETLSLLYNAIDGAFTSEATKNYLRRCIDEL